MFLGEEENEEADVEEEEEYEDEEEEEEEDEYEEYIDDEEPGTFLLYGERERDRDENGVLHADRAWACSGLLQADSESSVELEPVSEPEFKPDLEPELELAFDPLSEASESRLQRVWGMPAPVDVDFGSEIYEENAAGFESTADFVDSDVKDVVKKWNKWVRKYGNSSDDDEMMRFWSKLLDAKEEEALRRPMVKRNKALPAYLTGWTLSNDVDSLVDDGSSRAKYLSVVNDPLYKDPLYKAASEVVLETQDENADDMDDDFVAEWQVHAEQMRAESALEKKATPARPASFFERWFGGKDDAVSRTTVDTIGIDLGTTNMAVAAIINGTAQIIPRDHPEVGQRVWPSYVSYLERPRLEQKTRCSSPLGIRRYGPVRKSDTELRVVVGQEAIDEEAGNVPNTYSSTKRLIGRTASAEELKRLQALDVEARMFRSGGQNDTQPDRVILLACPAMRKAITAVDVAAELVHAAVLQAEAHLERNITSAVITVPAYFDDAQRQHTVEAAQDAGLKRVRLLHEPEAAALTFALEQEKDTRIMVFDLGGGTFDVSIVDVGKGVIEVIASSGDPRLGGNDWDNAIASWLESEYWSQNGHPPDAVAKKRLLHLAEDAKRRLSIEQSYNIYSPAITYDEDDEAYSINVTLSRRKMEAICRHLLLRLVPPMQQVAEMAGIELDSKNMGTLVKGNLSNAPRGVQRWQQTVAWRWQRMVKRRFNVGAVTRKEAPKANVPISQVLLVGGATRMPCIGRFIKRMTGLKAVPSVDPDVAVALGAAVQAGILDGVIKQKLFNPYLDEDNIDGYDLTVGEKAQKEKEEDQREQQTSVQKKELEERTEDAYSPEEPDRTNLEWEVDARKGKRKSGKLTPKELAEIGFSPRIDSSMLR